MEATIQFSPACPTPVPLDVQKRIQEFRSFSILYQSGHKILRNRGNYGMKPVHIKDGKIVPLEETFKGPSPSISEGRFYWLAEKHAVNLRTCIIRTALN
jgi:hypothetical protein